MRTIESRIQIAAHPETVWRILTDFGRYPAWNPFIVSAHGKIAEGSRLLVSVRPPGGNEHRFRPVVKKVIRARELTWKGRTFLPLVLDGRHSFLLEPLDGGGTYFTQREAFRGILVAPLSGTIDRTREGFEQMNAELKREAESA